MDLVTGVFLWTEKLVAENEQADTGQHQQGTDDAGQQDSIFHSQHLCCLGCHEPVLDDGGSHADTHHQATKCSRVDTLAPDGDHTTECRKKQNSGKQVPDVGLGIPAECDQPILALLATDRDLFHTGLKGHFLDLHLASLPMTPVTSFCHDSFPGQEKSDQRRGLEKPLDRAAVIDLVRAILLVNPGCRLGYPQQVIDRGRHVVWLLRIGGRVTANLVG